MSSYPSVPPNWSGPDEPTEPIQPYPSSQPTPYGEPGGYVQPQPYFSPTPYGQTPRYDQPAPYGRVVPYGQASSPEQSPYVGPYGQPAPYDAQHLAYAAGPYVVQKSRMAAGLLAIFLGGLGIHNFYLGRVGPGLTQLLISVLSFGFLAPLIWIWSLVEGILILTRSPSFSTDKRGIPLRD